MVAALELYFDAVTERRIRRLWAALQGAGVPAMGEHTQRLHRPHISLVAADELDPGRAAAALEGLTVGAPLPVSLQNVGLFRGGVLWLGPASSNELLGRHAEVVDRLTTAGLAIWPYYLPGAWVPHCTLSMGARSELLARAVPLCLDVLPVDGTLVGAAVADHSRGHYHPLTA